MMANKFVTKVIMTSLFISFFSSSNASNLYKSTDNGATWRTIKIAERGSFLSIAIDPITPTTLYVGGFISPLSKSTDGGETWHILHNGVDNIDDIFDITIDKLNPNIIYVATQGPLLLKSTDGGETWTRLPSFAEVWKIIIDPLMSTTIYAGTNKGLYKSLDSGKTWAGPQALPGTSAIAFDTTTFPRTIYAGVSTPFENDNYPTIARGVFKSKNDGLSWEDSTKGFGSDYVSTIIAHPINPLTLYAGSEADFNHTGHGVFKSIDGGATWHPINKGLLDTTVISLVMNQTTPTILFAGTNKNLYQTIDGGVTWRATNVTQFNQGISSIAIDPATSTTIYAAEGPFIIYKKR